MLITNRVNAILDIDAICTDFDIYRVSRDSAKLEKTNILDIPETDFKALAVQYKYGKDSFGLFSKGAVIESEFRMKLQEEYKDVTVYKITKADLLDGDFCIKNFKFGNRLLVQLLLNSIKTPRTEGLSYNNLTGKLYYGNSAWRKKDKKNGGIGSIYFLELVLDPGMYLNINVKTFRRSNDSYKGKYVIDPITGDFRRKLKTDSATLTAYEFGSPDDKHNTVKFLDITNFQNFQQCKMGVMERFMQDSERKLSKYLKLEFCEAEKAESYELASRKKPRDVQMQMGQLLNRRGVVIVDENNTETSREIASRLKDEFVRYYGINCTEGDLDADKYNVRIIHEPKYYSVMKIEDPHCNVKKGMMVQHVEEESELFDEKAKASSAVNKIVQELVIKGDIAENQISIYDWKELGFEKTFTFVTREKIKQAFDKNRKPHTNRNGDSVYDNYEYSTLSINPDGELVFEKFNDNSSAECTKEQDIVILAYEKFHSDYRRYECVVEGLVFSDVDNIHGIIRTPEKTIPNIRALWDGLKQTDKNIPIDKNALVDAIRAFLLDNDLDKVEIAYINNLLDKLIGCEESIKTQDVRKMMNFHKAIAKRLNRYMHEYFNIWISPELKDSDFEEDYLLNNLLDIKYYNKFEYEILSFNYYVGKKSTSLKLDIQNGCPIRKVVSQVNKIEFEELLPLMDVEFVRNEQLTVIPFPFKYLREWNLMQG